eukprot:Hpha_TRINITY_DN16367_c1_g4::TRINITY_DN16367_c1_g4_i1::g.62876::m.62876/K10394/KIF3A; kinesin family member 3A
MASFNSSSYSRAYSPTFKRMESVKDCASPTATGGGNSSCSSVKAFVRVRPLSDRERDRTQRTLLRVTDTICTVFDHERKFEPKVSYTFDGCFWSVPPDETEQLLPGHPSTYASQEDVYNACGKPMVKNVLEGYNGCLLAYGQTGSGKTYTMTGGDDYYHSELRGVIPRVCEELLHHADPSSAITASYVEVYNEQWYDLLARGERRTLRQYPDAGWRLQDVHQTRIDDVESAMRLIQTGDGERRKASTAMNRCSSRSHAILTLTVVIRAGMDPGSPGGRADDEARRGALQGKMHLVDLAGSERIRKSETEESERLREEATKINLSLTTLGRVIDRLAEAAQGIARGVHVPYRDSALTMFLQDSLGGNSRTGLIATVSPSPLFHEETCQTLRYASHARKIVNVVVRNQGTPEVARIRQLEAQLELAQRQTVSRRPAEGMLDKMVELESRCALYEERIGELIQLHSSKVQEKSARQAAQRDVRSGLESKLQRSERDIEKWKERAGQVQRELEQALRDNAHDKSKVEQAIQAKKAAEKRAREAEKEATKCQRLEGELKEAEERVKRLGKQRSELVDKMDELMEQAAEEDELCAAITRARQQAEVERDAALDRTSELEATVEGLREQLTQAAPPGTEEEISRLRSECTRLAQEAQAARASARAAQQSVEDDRRASERRSQLEKEKAGLMADVQRIRGEYEECRRVLARAKADSVDAKKQAERESQRAQELEEARDALADELSTVGQRAKGSQAELDDLRAKLAEASQQVSDFSAALVAEQSEVQGLQESLDQAVADVASLEGEVELQRAQLQKRDERISSDAAELEAGRDRVRRLEETIREGEATLESTRAEASAGAERCSALEKRLGELQDEHTTLQAEKAARAAGEEEASRKVAELEETLAQEQAAQVTLKGQHEAERELLTTEYEGKLEQERSAQVSAVDALKSEHDTERARLVAEHEEKLAQEQSAQVSLKTEHDAERERLVA